MIKTIGAEQDNPPPEPSGAELVAGAAPGESVEAQTPADTPLLTLEEKRRILARIARVDPLDCFDETGAFDIVRAKRILPPGAVRHISVHETTRLNAEGQPVTERRIDVRLVDPVSALRLDDLLERRREPTASNSNSTSKNFTRRDFNLLTAKTMALDDANQSIELLKKALAEANDRELKLSKELEEKDRQLPQTLSKVEGEAAQSGTQTTSSSDQSASSSLALQSRGQSLTLRNAEGSNESTAKLPPERPVNATTKIPSSQSKLPKPLSSIEVKSVRLTEQERRALSTATGEVLRELQELEIQSINQEAIEAEGSMGSGIFSAWLRSKGIERVPIPPHTLVKDQAIRYRKIPPRRLASIPARPPPHLDPMHPCSQGRPREIR